MSRTARRILLYGAGVAILAGLGYAGFLYEPPPDPITRLTGARMLAGAGNIPAALEICDVVAREHPGCFEERLFRSAILAQAERYEEALPVFDDAIACAPDESVRRDLEADRASVLLALGRTDEFDAVRARLAQDGTDHRPFLLDATAAEREGRWDDALEAYAAADERLAKTGLDTTWVRNQRARCHMLAGRAASDRDDAQAAGAHFDAACELAPKNVEARLMAARARLDLKEIDAAVDLVRQAHELAPALVERRLAADEAWASLREDPRIRALVPDRDG